jgi:catechol 2,3-dioxygenase-like lactoylglutathione lyase family enzyme
MLGPPGARLAGVELYFEDLRGARAFYEGVLGLKVGDEEEGRHVRFGAGGAFLCCERKGVESYPSADKAVLFLEVPDVARAAEALGDRVVARYLGGPRPWAVLHDPEGHNVMLLEGPRGA